MRLHPDLLAEGEKIIRGAVDDDDILHVRSRDNVYNCAGMIFSARRTQIDIEDFEWIVEDDGYRELSEADISYGDLVFYYKEEKPKHVGVIVKRQTEETWVLSQWGSYCEILHPLRVTYEAYGEPRRFFTDRK
ncbi:MAG TPA: hypothetical protein VMG98_02405 [Verrucomicrobiae bacterium]|nr:hypothetical protein [Verrucomicrobiae bacterium]